MKILIAEIIAADDVSHRYIASFCQKQDVIVHACDRPTEFYLMKSDWLIAAIIYKYVAVLIYQFASNTWHKKYLQYVYHANKNYFIYLSHSGIVTKIVCHTSNRFSLKSNA